MTIPQHSDTDAPKSETTSGEPAPKKNGSGEKFDPYEYFVIFDRAKPGLTLEKAEVVVIGEDHFTGKKEQQQLLQYLGGPNKVILYLEGTEVGEVTKRDGYTAHGTEYGELNFRAMAAHGPVDKAYLRFLTAQAENQSQAEKAYLRAIVDFYTIQVLRDHYAAARVSVGSDMAGEKGKTKVLIEGLTHVVGTHTSTLLPDLTKYGINWVALVPRQRPNPSVFSYDPTLGIVEILQQRGQLTWPTSPLILTKDNHDPLYRLYYDQNRQGRISSYYDPYAGQSKFPFTLEPIIIKEKIDFEKRVQEKLR